jgi:hypothetical protein
MLLSDQMPHLNECETGIDFGLYIQRRFHPDDYGKQLEKVPEMVRQEATEYLRIIYQRWKLAVKTQAKLNALKQLEQRSRAA